MHGSANKPSSGPTPTPGGAGPDPEPKQRPMRGNAPSYAYQPHSAPQRPMPQGDQNNWARPGPNNNTYSRWHEQTNWGASAPNKRTGPQYHNQPARGSQETRPPNAQRMPAQSTEPVDPEGWYCVAPYNRLSSAKVDTPNHDRKQSCKQGKRPHPDHPGKYKNIADCYEHCDYEGPTL
jgi:hypothetical protein